MKYAASRPWPGRAGSADRRVFEAHAKIAFKAGKEIYHASSRDLAEIAGCDRRTASRATRRLGERDLIRLVQSSSYSFANRYRLGEFDTTGPLISGSKMSMGVGQSSTFELPDAFRQRGLGRSAFEVFLALHQTPLSVKFIADRTGRDPQTVRGALRRLASVGLVRQERRLWAILKRLEQVNMLTLAAEVGTAGALHKQKQKHRRERLRRSISNSILGKYGLRK
jgi:DNA-binding MarR family transcriptional regulator